MTKDIIKGPWRIGDAGNTVFGPPNGTPAPVTVAKLVHKEFGPLIAAAPDLLAALRECVTDDGARCLNDDPRGERARRRLYAINDIARAAIAKAEGRAS